MPDLGDVPLRHDDERRGHRLAGEVRDRLVLLDDALARVDEDERDVGPLGGLQRSQLRVVLDPLTLLALAPNARCVDEHEGSLAALQNGVDRVAGRAGLLGDDHALLSDQRVEQARLADVRTAEDRDADRLLSGLRRAAARQPRDDRVQEVAGAVAVDRGDRDRVAEPEAVELERLRLGAGLIDLVRDQEDRLARAAQDRGQLLVAGRDARPRVDDEEDEVGLGDRAARLLGDLLRQRRRVGHVHAAGVHEQEAPARPLADELLAVACDARGLVHDCLTGAGQAVDERRLAHVREPDDGDRAEQLVGAHGGVGFCWPTLLVMLTQPAPEAVDLLLDEEEASR